jgi:hypothetical protein
MNAAPMMPPTTTQLSFDAPCGNSGVTPGVAITPESAPLVGVGLAVVVGLVVIVGLDVFVGSGFNVDVMVGTDEGVGVGEVAVLPILTCPLFTVVPLSITPVWSAISASVRVIDDRPLTPDLAVI